MIELTVKTLDSQNHSFTVEDDITVAQFKEHIAGVINIPTESQRLIYCGRVLQDAKKLQEYDVNGKVIHLVQRAPPSSTTRRSRSPTQPPINTRRLFQAPVYLGSMALPSGLMEAQGIVPPPPTQSLSGSRLNVARRMLRRADNILNNLEDPQGTRTHESPTEEPQDDVTPVFAAQVFVPNAGSDDALAAAMSAVENGILQDQAAAVPAETNTESPATPMNVEQNQDTQETQATATSTNSPSTNAETGQNSARDRPGQLPENSSRTSEMARLLDDLNRVQERLKPFMERYHSFMAEDPTVEGEQGSDTVRQTQNVINRVSEIMHLLGHAYHSLSDVMVQVSQAPPRPLLCRPILIQHSAVLQAGIPIQVEAQINLAPDRRPSDNNAGTETTATNATATNTTSTAADSTTGSTTSTTTPATDTQPRPQPTITTQQIRPNVHEIRIDSFPIDIRNISRHMVQNAQEMSRRQQMNNNSVPPQDTSAASGEGQTTAPPNAAAGGEQNPIDLSQQRQGTDPVVVMPPVFVNNMNPNMEFFMEVTPESITIDSLETTVVTSAAQADNVLRGTFGGAPPEFIQSILQAVAGQMMGGGATNMPPTTTGATSQPSATAAATTEASQTQEPCTASTTQSTTATGTNINSQARSNTQTHPTTATQTRSTARPHVHLAQHTMQGFDPFLPCNSHHIRRRRMGAQAGPTAAGGAQNATAPEAEAQNNNQQPNPLYSILQGFLRTVGNQVGRMQRERPAQQETTTTTTTTSAAPTTAQPPPPPPTVTTTASATSTTQQSADPLPPFSTFLSQNLDLSQLSRLAMDSRNTQGATIAALLQNFSDHNYVEGESVFTDLMMTLARSLTFGDIVALIAGQLYPLVRIRPALRTFFRNRVLQGECPTQPAIDRGASRLIAEIMPVLSHLETMPVREDIDIVQSMVLLFRCRFPSIISLVMSRMTRSLSCLVDQCMLTLRHLCGLIMHCSVNGRSDVENICRTLIQRCIVGISPNMSEWIVDSSMTLLSAFLSTLDVPEASIQPYIVKRSDNRLPEATPPVVAPEVEPMECEDAPAMETEVPEAPIPEPNAVPVVESSPAIDLEGLPNVVIGSEPWHRVTPRDWIPIITRDIQRQRRQGAQPPFSDAYLSGMPSKRRKIVQANKPQGNIAQIISDGVKRAVTASGLTTAVSVETVAQAASIDVNLQSAYRDLLRTRVQESLRENPDFNPDRFPNASNYFNVK